MYRQYAERIGDNGGITMKWEKTGRTVKADGSKTVRYECGDLAIESRKRPIPHSNGVGSWLHTSYFLIKADGTEKEYWSLSDAKEAAES